jgi:hypothetical protein
MIPPLPDDLSTRSDASDNAADEFQGDLHAADIVAPTGEEMPVATHAEVHQPPRIGSIHSVSPIAAKRDTRSTRVGDAPSGDSM